MKVKIIPAEFFEDKESVFYGNTLIDDRSLSLEISKRDDGYFDMELMIEDNSIEFPKTFPYMEGPKVRGIIIKV